MSNLRYYPFVSVIVPNYNHARYLDQRLQSIFNQTYQDFEVIILDDCSPDGGASKKVIEKYRDNLHVSHIVYNEVNSGSTFKQWEIGFCLAQGELIWIAESDDYCSDAFLEQCVYEYIKHPDASVIWATSSLVDSQGNNLQYKDIAESIPYLALDGKDFIRRYMCSRNSIWNASAVLFPSRFVKTIQKDYVNYRAAGDHLFWIELAEFGKVIHVNKKLNFFRQHTQKVTPANYRNGVTHSEELNTVKYIYNKGYMPLRLKHTTMLHFLREIELFEYDNDEIKNQLLREWRDFDFVLYYFCLCRIKLGLVWN